jgi:translation initiation factor 1
MEKDRVVYSSELGRLCPECQQAIKSCNCDARKRETVQGDGVVRMRRETKGRGGKTVVVITGLPLNHDQLKTLLTDLKRRCGTGGTIKDGALEIQGEHLDLLRTELVKRGYKPKG